MEEKIEFNNKPLSKKYKGRAILFLSLTAISSIIGGLVGKLSCFLNPGDMCGALIIFFWPIDIIFYIFFLYFIIAYIRATSRNVWQAVLVVIVFTCISIAVFGRFSMGVFF